MKKRGACAHFAFFLSLLRFMMIFTPKNGSAIDAPKDFPHVIVPRQQKRFDTLREMFWLHYPGCVPQPTLWDEWLVSPALWPRVDAKQSLAQRWKQCLESRLIDEDGYVSSHQHASIAHPGGWPFPAWIHGKGGAGWHFSFKNTAPPPFRHDQISTCALWLLDGVKDKGIDENGWNVILERQNAALQPPSCEIDAFQAPFLQLRWSSPGLKNSQPCVEWRSNDSPQFDPEHRMYFEPPQDSDTVFTLIPLYKHPAWKETITGLRLCFDNKTAGTPVTIQAFFTTYDTRHNVNNPSYITGCVTYFWWTRDLDFLRKNMNRMRKALRHIMIEHNALQENVVHTKWRGHSGKSGLQRDAKGQKTILFGTGIGGNYWDLLPFGGKDAYATMRYYAALNKMSELESEIRMHPEWNIPEGALGFSPENLALHAIDVKETVNRIFWNPDTMRFVACIDEEGEKHDYGLTFLNLEAIHYDFASPEHAKEIMDWICGDRIIPGDTSQGADIYHWRFAPRATTLRNTDYYYWAWQNPEDIPWGGQVQDGGAVLGFSYHDLSARMKVRGADNAWNRLKEIITWFEEVQDAGGYRAYYNEKREGTLQGGGPAGGLGVDREFTESALVPQIILDGFLGFSPRGDGFCLNPEFPSEWREIAMDGICLHGIELEIKATTSSIKITRKDAYADPMYIRLPREEWSMILISPNGIATRIKTFMTRAADGAIEIPWANTESVIFIKKDR
ncbi:hypothetical protein JW926_03530 [Candidatus Sumerlaeota bacterium]|nr:hypothetical protein [Candidatus Sumerlaeota bacterium]